MSHFYINSTGCVKSILHSGGELGYRSRFVLPFWLIFANYATHKSTNTAKNSYICISTDYSI